MILLFPYFIRGPAKAALPHRATAEIKENHHQEGELTTYCQVVNYFLAWCATDNVMVEAKAEIANFKQPAAVTTIRYSEALLEEKLRCGSVHYEPRLRGDLYRRSTPIYPLLYAYPLGKAQGSYFIKLSASCNLSLKITWRYRYSHIIHSWRDRKPTEVVQIDRRPKKGHPSVGHTRSRAQLVVSLGR